MFLVVILACLVSGASGRTCSCGGNANGYSVNVRTCASSSCSKIGVITPGDCYDYNNMVGQWHNVTFNGQVGFSHGNYLTGPWTNQCGGGSTGLCTANLCSTYTSNQKRGCDSYGCGTFGASRGSRTHTGWDLKCSNGAEVYAPFDGTLVRVARPYGDGTCCDTGFLITGTGSWSGHSVKIFYSEPISSLIGQSVTKGQHIADHVGLLCGCYSSGMTDHLHYQLDLNGQRIDPASYIFC